MFTDSTRNGLKAFHMLSGISCTLATNDKKDKHHFKVSLFDPSQFLNPGWPIGRAHEYTIPLDSPDQEKLSTPSSLLGSLSLLSSAKHNQVQYSTIS